ncbi:MAG: DinB family protein [Terriglobales bacterium]
MTIAEALLAEFEQQAPVTRRFLERLPEGKLGWQPHPKSMTAGQLALHLATVPGGAVRSAGQDPSPLPDFIFPAPASVAAILGAFDDSNATVRELLPKFSDASMNESWRLVAADGRELRAMPRMAFVRNIMLNHWYQHRGQFSVYLRLLGVAVPSSWGPSADEPI